ncbi:MAG: PAS domain S-box protein, partial [Chloroflexi bacterium]|nr:PAS domain S-box protein [Chloroflexota bacterium]
RNEEALRKAEEEYRAIFENATEGIFKSTPDGRFLLANPAMARIHGYDSPAELITSVTDIQNTLYVNPSRRTELVQALQQHGYVSGFKIEAYRKDRSVIWISMNAHAVKDKAGNILYWQGTIEDITERTRLEQQLRQADKLIAVGTLVSGIAHEVVNPLSGALGRADLLLRGDLQGSLRDDVQVIRDEVERGLKILRNLLFFARGYKPEKTYISVNTCLENALVLRAYSHQVDNIHLQLDLQPDLPATLADPNQLQQLFLNLIINAEQAMVEANGRGTLSINSRQKDNAIRVTVADDGPGIPPQTLARLFEPFFTTKPVGKGTGLGLSICYGIAQEHGGAIHVASEVGKGAAFTVELPLVAPPGPGVELGAT